MFLRNGNSKVVKSQDGRCFLGYVTTPPTDSAETDYRNRKITFSITEIGNIEDGEDLFDAGFIPTVTEEWWNR